MILVIGTAEVTKKSRGSVTMNVRPTERVILISGSNVSSISAKDTKKISDQLIKGSNCVMLLPDGKQKVAKINKVKNISNRGVPALKIEFLSDDYDATGNFANNAANLEDLPVRFEVKSFFGWDSRNPINRNDELPEKYKRCLDKATNSKQRNECYDNYFR